MERTGKKRTKRKWSRSERRFFWLGLLFVSPWLIGFLAFNIYPICCAIYYSFTDFSIFTAPQWIGLKNYSDLLHDNLFWQSLGNTVYMCLIGLPLNLLAALGLAMLLHQKLKGRPLFRTIFYLPTVVPVVASVMLFMWILNPEYGLINMFLGLFGITGPSWLSDPNYTKLSLIIMDVWRCGGTMIIFLSSLANVPQTFYEAADIDGASPWTKFRKITIPCIGPTIQFNLIIGLINTFQYFTQAQVLGRLSPSYVTSFGGPENSVMFYSLYLYTKGFANLHMGYASAMALILFVIVMIVSFFTLRFTESQINYDVE